MFSKLTGVFALALTVMYFTSSPAVERAQRNKLELGGDFSFSYDNYDFQGFDQGSITSISLSPRFGFFVGRNVNWSRR